MFASQLLRILQTIPSDEEYENCVYDSVEQDTTMKENQNPALYDSRSLGREADPLSFGSKDVYQLNGLKTNTHPLVFEVNDRDECWNANFVDDFSMDNQNENGVLSHPSSSGEDSDSLSSDTNDKDKEQTTREHKCPMIVGEFTHCNENQPVTALDLFETDANSYTDKYVAQFEQPELMICYKEINYHAVKDICVYEGMKLSHSKDDQSGDMDGVGAGADENECKDERPGPKLPLESSSDNDSGQKDETNGATEKTMTVASEEAYLVDRTLPIQEFGTRSFLRSFLNSLDGEGNKETQLLDQVSSRKPVLPAVSPAGSRQKEDVQESILHYNSEVEGGTITFNFNSPAPLIADVTNGRTEDSTNVLNHKNADSGNPSDIMQAHCNKNVQEMNAKNVQDQPHKDKDENSNNLEDSQVNESHILKLEQGKYDEGEASFSAAGVVTYSGPISYSGSVSLRSDSSATSARSFAFPILQPEWNTSPERMITKGDGRHFRKHKGWRSGLLCCRF